jgi:uncharacterized ferredoxin-like protein
MSEKTKLCIDKTAVEIVLKLMALAAHTAPKSFAMDCLEVEISSESAKKSIVSTMRSLGELKSASAKTDNKAKAISLDWSSDAEAIEKSDGILLIGIRGTVAPGVNCGACGFPSCAEMVTAPRAEGDFPGPFCMYRLLDLGIAVSSAVGVAANHFLDNRMFQKVGIAAIKLNLLQCAPIIGIGVSSSAKNIFFDRKDKAIAASLTKTE